MFCEACLGHGLPPAAAAAPMPRMLEALRPTDGGAFNPGQRDR